MLLMVDGGSVVVCGLVGGDWKVLGLGGGCIVDGGSVGGGFVVDGGSMGGGVVDDGLVGGDWKVLGGCVVDGLVDLGLGGGCVVWGLGCISMLGLFGVCDEFLC